MNKSYDYNGIQVAKSNPVHKLRTVKKTIHIDSADRDVTLYTRNGDFVVYLPRVYENVVSIAITQAEFPTFSESSTFDRVTGDVALQKDLKYFFMSLGGLNKGDECAIGANKSTFTDSVFAKFQVSSKETNLFYTEGSGPQIIEYYRPAISKLDRLQVRMSTHGQNSNQIIFWPSVDFSFSLELEMLENSFDDFSSFETRLSDRTASGFFGC